MGIVAETRKKLSNLRVRGCQKCQKPPFGTFGTALPGDSEVFTLSNINNTSTPDAVLSEIEEAPIRAWLDHIGEADPEMIAGCIDKCRTDKETRDYFLRRAEAVFLADDWNDRRPCSECANLAQNGLCLAAKRGEIIAGNFYRPVDHILRRCDGFTPRLASWIH